MRSNVYLCGKPCRQDEELYTAHGTPRAHSTERRRDSTSRRISAMLSATYVQRAANSGSEREAEPDDDRPPSAPVMAAFIIVSTGRA